MTDLEFFRTCWLALKKAKPRLRKLMDEIEFSVGGKPKIYESPKKKAKKESNDTKESVIV